MLTVGIVPLMVMGLALTWVWKSNQVKEYYLKMRKLENQRSDLVSENMRLRADLMDLKSLSRIDDLVTREFGLTQNVSQRIFLLDPVRGEKKPGSLEFVGDMEIPGWIETAIIGSGGVMADSPKHAPKKAH
jgi:hypothetical protein